jgi:2-oxoglutarate dehydrogenase E2 component (dihydrolipoamide succinyltransferase)
MSVEIRVPPLGESLVEATVGRWFKKQGDAVQTGETVVELETEKVNLEVAAPESGVLERVLHAEGDTVQVGEVLGTLDAGAAAAPRPEAARSAAASAPAPAPTVAERAPGSAPAEAPAGASRAAAVPPRPPAAPSARRLAAEHGVDLGAVAGSGPGGRITGEDVRDHVLKGDRTSEPPAPAKTGPPNGNGGDAGPGLAVDTNGRREERVRMSRRRQTIARRLVEAQQTAAILTTFNEIDMHAVMELRKRRRDAFKERHGVGLGFMSFFTRATVGALKAFPQLNAEIQGEEIVLKQYYDIGVAVSTEQGLVVPVVRDADRLSFPEIERQIERFAKAARENRLTPQDLIGGTFTITNGGVFGSLLSTPILNMPQVGILGMHKIQERPVAIAGEVAIRPMMYVALSYDHRVIDGREAVQFLVRIKELVEDPEQLLLEG